MGGYTVVSIDRTTRQERCLDSIGSIGGMSYDHDEHGPLTTQWQLDCPPASGDPALTPGRLIEIWGGGGCVWSGSLGESDPGIPRTMHAAGHQQDFQTLPSATWTTPSGVLTPTASTDLQAVIDSIISTWGLPIHRNAAFPAMASTIVDQPTSVADLANAYTQASGQRWKISVHRNMTFAADPTTPDYLYVMADPFGRSPDGYKSDEFVLYNQDTLVGGVTVTAKEWAAVLSNPSATAVRPFGPVIGIEDITNQPAMTAAQAKALFAQARTLIGNRLTFTGNCDAVPGQILNMGGMSVDLGTVIPGQAVLLVGANADVMTGDENWTGGVTVPIGQTSYDVDSDVLTWQPVNTLRQDFLGFIEHTADYQ